MFNKSFKVTSIHSDPDPEGISLSGSMQIRIRNTALKTPNTIYRGTIRENSNLLSGFYISIQILRFLIFYC